MAYRNLTITPIPLHVFHKIVVQMSFSLLPQLREAIIHRNVTSTDILYRLIYPLR